MTSGCFKKILLSIYIRSTMLYHVQTVKNQVRFDYYSVVISFKENKQEYTIK